MTTRGELQRVIDHEYRQEEEKAVRMLGDRIGYGRLMQLAEQVWSAVLVEKGVPPGGAHSVGPCVATLVPCPCVSGMGRYTHCDWCCGSKRVTKRVRDAMLESKQRCTTDAVPPPSEHGANFGVQWETEYPELWLMTCRSCKHVGVWPQDEMNTYACSGCDRTYTKRI